ncbi:MAG: hypothetical protein DLM72_03295 [Candidatus Nitrosopolaris wilkensis]|nr:MAG: hypothetical protein DLM72_03295 [Candidatus Nitrosopolaris wilkensis]
MILGHGDLNGQQRIFYINDPYMNSQTSPTIILNVISIGLRGSFQSVNNYCDYWYDIFNNEHSTEIDYESYQNCYVTDVYHEPNFSFRVECNQPPAD